MSVPRATSPTNSSTDKVDLIAPCTTPSAQAAVRAARSANVPVVFGCVTNPVEAGLIGSLDKPSGSNVTGTYGFPPVARMFDVIQQISPKVRRIGTIYNGGESNSTTFARLSKVEAERRGLTWVEIAISGSAEVKTAAEFSRWPCRCAADRAGQHRGLGVRCGGEDGAGRQAAAVLLRRHRGGAWGDRVVRPEPIPDRSGLGEGTGGAGTAGPGSWQARCRCRTMPTTCN